MKYFFSIILFISSILAFYFALQSCWTKGKKDMERCLFSVFCFSSGVWSLGFGTLIVQTDTEMAKRQEKAGKEGNYSYIDSHLEEFLQEYRKLLANVRAVLEDYHMPEPAALSDQTGSLEEPEVRRLLQEIQRSLSEFDFANASNLIKDTDVSHIPEKYRDGFARMDQWMDELEVERLQEEIENYLNI